MTDEQLLYFETHQNDQNTEWVVFVHGAGGSTRTWKRQIDPFGEKYNLLVVDLPGHGQNASRPTLASSYSFGSIAKQIWEIIDHLKIGAVHVIGISLGTIIGLEIRAQRPQHVLSVVLPGAIVRLNTKLKVLANLSLTFAKIIGYPNFYKLSALIMMPRANHKSSRDIFIKESQVLTLDEFKKWTKLYYGLNKTLKRLFKLPSNIPHLLVMGAQDHLFLKPSVAYSTFHNNAEFKIIDKCGHVVSIEKAKIFNEICLNFLNSIKPNK